MAEKDKGKYTKQLVDLASDPRWETDTSSDVEPDPDLIHGDMKARGVKPGDLLPKYRASYEAYLKAHENDGGEE